MDWSSILATAITYLVGTQAMYFALAAIGLNLHFGYTGLLNFGVAGFMTVGAYGMAVSIWRYGLPMPIAIIIGLILAAIFALILGIPTLRLRADYLGIATIAAAEIVRIIVRATALRDYTGGSNGLNGFTQDLRDVNPIDGRPSFSIGSVEIAFGGYELFVMLIGWTFVLLGVLLVYLLIRSPWGRVLTAVREDEDAARALGKNAYAIKMQSLVLGGLFCALGGIFSVISQGSVQPSPQDLGTPKTFFIWVALILGGTGRLWAPVIGSMIFSSLLATTDQILRQMESADMIPESIMTGVQIGQVRFMLLGLGLMLLMIYRPQGIFGDKKEMALDAR